MSVASKWFCKRSRKSSAHVCVSLKSFGPSGTSRAPPATKVRADRSERGSTSATAGSGTASG
eukprot:9680427-Alexandrium_andersonii.AAC.1